jgi:hypothetical protein
MTALHRDSILPIDDLLARIRACIADTPSEAIVSLTINVERTGETTMFRLSVRPDGTLISLSTENAASSPSSEFTAQQLQSTTPPPPQHSPPHGDTPQSSTHMAMDEEEHPIVSSSNGVSDEKGSMDEDEEEDDVDIHQHPQPETAPEAAPEDGLERATPASISAVRNHDNSASSSVAQTSSSGDNIRRSARQQHLPERLAYPTAASSTSITAKRVKGMKRTAETDAGSATHADTAESTDTESPEESDSVWTSSSSSSAASSSKRSAPCQQHKKHKKLRHTDAHHSVLCSDDSGEEQQVAALVVKLREAHDRRQKQLDWESVSEQAVLQLGRDILGDGDGTEVDSLVYQQCATKIELLISTSTAMRMVGYYLRSVLAARLKRSHKNKYVRSARLLLGLKSSADITAYPAFYAFVQQHCPSLASGADGVMDLDAWLQEPIFLADIGWAEWRRYLSKSHRWIIDSAIERLTASLQPPRDWMQRGWVAEYDDPCLGRGVRAVRDIPLPVSNQRHHSSAVDGVVADLCLLAQAQQPDCDSTRPNAPWYRFEWDGGKQQLDAERLWVGRVNHLPMPHCNLKVTGNGKLVQRRAIAAGEALTFDYGVQWWAHRVTGVTWNEWMTTGTPNCRKGSAELFYRMHESVLDYTPLLAMGWDQRLDNATSELEREAVMMEMWEAVNGRDEDGETAA